MPADHVQRAQTLKQVSPLLIVAIIAAVLGSFYSFFLQHEIVKFSSGGSYNTETSQRRLAERTAYLEQLRKLDALFGAYAENSQSAFAQIAPPSKDIPMIFMLFERIAHQHNLGLQLIDIVSQDANRKDAPGVKEMTIALKLTNLDYKRLKQLLADLESSARLTDVVSFDFDPQGQMLGVTLKMYYFAGKK